MIYLIGQLAIPLLLTMLAMVFAGWMFAAERAAPKEAAAKRERENLLRDLIRFTGDGPVEREAELDAAPTQRLLEIRDGRVAELERALETARGRTDELASQLAVAQRGGQLNDLDAAELARLRAAEIERARTVDVEVEPVTEEPAEDENIALQAWRLRYFEQRVAYLETRAPAAAAPLMDATETQDAPPLQEWVAREATARAAFLEDELRRAQEIPEAEPAVTEAEPFAANADVDMLLRWRLLYLERRVAHLQAIPAAQPELVAALPEVQADPDRWKWRARYLEARVRHLEQRPPQMVAAPVAAAEQEVAPVRVAAQTVARRSKPPVLPAARNGAPDDLTLIEGVSLLQQTTMYSLGVFHFDQIAAWSEENAAWVDQYLRLQGRIGDEEWVEQAGELAEHGPAAARRALESEDA
jgi:predicted flap endonuclease-1-like 5' DNA nuclease